MSGHPDPRMNLALPLGKTGRAQARRALEVHPEHRPTVQDPTRPEVSACRIDDETLQWPDTLGLEDDNSAWRRWARALVLLHRAR